MSRIPASLRLLRTSDDGASATEFALLAPLLVFSFLAMTDLGRAIFEKIAIDQSLRAGFEAAMIDPGEAQVASVIADAAGEMFEVTFPTENQTGDTGGALASGTPDTLSVTVERLCACPSAVQTSVSCTTRCTATTFPYAFYALDAEKYFEGVLLPRFELSSQLDVQVQ